jgi:hypothetical protein
MGLLSGGQPDDIKRAFRFLRAHQSWTIRSIYGGAAYVATENLDHSAHVIAMHSLGKLIDRLEKETAQ